MRPLRGDRRVDTDKTGDVFFESGDVNHTVFKKTDKPNQHLLFEILPAELQGPSLIPVQGHKTH